MPETATLNNKAMQPLRPILKALYTVSRRDRKSLWSFATNNLFLATFLLGIGGLFFVFLMAAVLIFPLSSDPLRKIPAERLDLWPLTKRDRIALHALSPWMNPVAWILAVVAIWAAFHHAPIAGLAILLIPAAGLALSWLPRGANFTLWRAIPALPGVLGQLIRKDLREILSTLDFWVALALSVSCTGYRWFVHALPDDALMMFSILVVLALSSWAQSCFGLDGAEGVVRYSLLPLRGWQIFTAKAIAFLIAVTVLALPLSLPVAWASALVALAVRFAGSLDLKPQCRWRFSSGSSGWNSVMQIVALAAAGAAAFRINPAVLIPSFLLFVVVLLVWPQAV
jgi:hypothetical protein